MFTLPQLPYPYDALTKCMSADTLKFHHDKHHQTYVDKLNAAIQANPEYKDKSIEDLLANIETIAEPARTAIRNNGGGHYNHTLFWESMSPTGGGEPTGEVAKLIEGRYGSFQKFMDEYSAQATGLFGSGWTWLLANGDIINTQNQNTPISQGGAKPLLLLDLWEHAYYLDYQNKRADYIKAWWNVVDWGTVAKRYSSQ